MDSLISEAARALAIGDALGALRRVALRDDPPALALRGIAMAQLGELARAQQLLRRAARGFGPRASLARARCALASAEVALAARELDPSDRALALAVRTLERHGDAINALQGRLIAVRRLLLLGRVEAAEHALARCALGAAPPMLAAIAALAAAELALRRLRAGDAQAAFARAQHAAARARIPALGREIARARDALSVPAARAIAAGRARPLRLAEVEAVLASPRLIIDACRYGVRRGPRGLSLARRPVLFALARMLGEACPAEVPRAALLARVFGARRSDESQRVRLRVELARLRRLLRPFAAVRATAAGFVLVPHGGRELVVLAPPVDGDAPALVALLADGAPWSTSALALALGASQRSVQRALGALEAAGAVRSLGRGRARRWLSPAISGFTPILLLPPALAIG